MQKRTVIYVRCSTDEQEPETQKLALRAEAERRGYRIVSELQDRTSGDPARRKRTPPGLSRAIEMIERRAADVLLIFAADRLVRHPIGLLQLVSRIRSAGGAVASLRDGSDLDTTTEHGELLLFLQGWFARFELKLTRERTRAGIARARAAGKRLGRPPLDPDQLAAIRELHGQQPGLSQSELGKRLGVSRWHVRKALQCVTQES